MLICLLFIGQYSFIQNYFHHFQMGWVVDFKFKFDRLHLCNSPWETRFSKRSDHIDIHWIIFSKGETHFFNRIYRTCYWINHLNGNCSLAFQVSLLHIDRLIDSICQGLVTKENYEEICGDLLALNVMTQKGIRIPPFTLREMKRCLQAFYSRFKDKHSHLEGL